MSAEILNMAKVTKMDWDYELKEKCPICGANMFGFADRIDMGVVEQTAYCLEGHYRYYFAHGGYKYTVGGKILGYYYSDSKEKIDRINKIVQKSIELFKLREMQVQARFEAERKVADYGFDMPWER